MHSIGYAMQGGWRYHGNGRPELVDGGTVIAGLPGRHYGCKHTAIRCDSVCAISLRPGALDESDSPIFHKQILNGLRLPALNRVLTVDDEERFDALIFEIFDQVSRASSLESSRLRRTDFRVQRMKRFIEQHAFEDIALTDIARCVDLSPFTCIRQFKKAINVTPLRYVSELRFQRAQKLLKKSRLSIAEVGLKVGMRDRFYFTRWFSREAGVPPKRFRQMYRS
jgi:AraC-like DNA-binding protein